MRNTNHARMILRLCLLGIGLGSMVHGEAMGKDVSETNESIIVSHPNYTLTVVKEGFRYSFQAPDGRPIADAHAVSGIRFTAPGGDQLFDVASTTLESFGENRVRMAVTNTNGNVAEVLVDLFDHHTRFSIIPRQGDSGSGKPGRFIIDARTGPLDPAFGLGDFGSHSNDFRDVDAPCNNNVSARDNARLMGLVRDEMTNQGSCRRFISNFVVFPANGFAQVLFNDAKKRVGLTDTENRLGVADEEKVDTLYYFIGDLKQIYWDYRVVRDSEGYRDVKPRYTMFNVGWEAYGALGWSTYQSSVMENIQTYLDRGFPLYWGVVGSGFWPGARNSRTQGTTVSFGMWDNTPTERDDGLPNPRYPDPQALKDLFEENNMSLIIGLRNHFKTPDNSGFNLKNDGRFPLDLVEQDFALRDRNGDRVRSEINQFPRGPLYFIDSHNEKAMGWFGEQAALWEADGFKEDAMIYDKLYHDGMWNPFNEWFAQAGYLVMVRNSAYSVPGDLIRINDSYAGTGENFHSDPHRIPLNLLNNAASGAANGYPDIIGGTPTTDSSTDTFRKYFVRNAVLAALTPGMSFGRGPWVMEHPEYEEIVLKAALWHDKYAPYIHSAAIDSYHTGFPYTMTPLHIAYPDDPNTYDLIDRERKQYQWMLGPSMLATPLFGMDFETAMTRDVYLPAGTWIDYETGEVYTGPATLKDFSLPESKIPVFIGGKGVVVSKQEARSENMNVEVFPVARDGSQYTYTYIDGRTTSTITNQNNGWNPETIIITDTTAGQPVDFEHNPVTGSFTFALIPGHDYKLTGGGE